MPEATEIEKDLATLAVDLRRLENEYNMFFAGRLPRPPLVLRSRTEQLIRKWDRGHIDNLSLRFRFLTLQSRFATFSELWDRGLRAREEGRPGPFMRGRQPARAGSPPSRDRAGTDRVVFVTAFAEPSREGDKLHALYESLMQARREAGAEAVPYERFAGLVRGQVDRLRAGGASEVAFRVAVSDGKVSLTAKAMRGTEGKRAREGGPGPPPRQSD